MANTCIAGVYMGLFFIYVGICISFVVHGQYKCVNSISLFYYIITDVFLTI